MPQQGDCRGFTWGICGNGSFNCQTQEQLVDEWLLIAVWDKPTFLSIWMMLPLFWWKQPSMYSLLLQPCWLQSHRWLLNLCISTGHVFTSLYVAHTLSTIHSSRQTFCFHYKNVKRLKHMTYLAIICGKKMGSAYPDSIGPHLPQWLFAPGRRNSCGEGIDQQSMGRHLQTWRSRVIWYTTTNGKGTPNKRGQHPRHVTVDCKNRQRPAWGFGWGYSWM